MNSKHAFLALSVFTLVSIAHGEREVFAPTKLAPVAEAGTIKFGDGAPAAPSMTFKNDDNTGFFRNGTDQIGYSLGGVIRGVMSGADLYVGGGTGSSAPGNGAIRATSGSGTNIGGGNLEIVGGNSTGSGAGGVVRILTAPAGASGSTPNTLTERMRINSAGAVMLNTTTVSNDTLNVNGRIGQTQNETLVWRDSSTNETASIVGTSVDANNGYLSLRTRGGGTASEKVRVKQGGQLRFVPLAAAPTVSVEDGDVYYNSTTNKLQVRAAGVWVDLH